MVGDGGTENLIDEIERLAQERDDMRTAAQMYAATVDDQVRILGDLRAEVERLTQENTRLREQLAMPCGSCHPCTNWADETWRREGKKPPHYHEWVAERDVIEKAKAWRVAEDDTAWGAAEAEQALADAVDALTQPEEPDSGP